MTPSPSPKSRGLRGGLLGASSSNPKAAQPAPVQAEEASFEGFGAEGRQISGVGELREFVPVGEGIVLPNSQAIAQRAHAASQVKPLAAAPAPKGATTSIRTAESERSGSLISTGL